VRRARFTKAVYSQIHLDFKMVLCKFYFSQILSPIKRSNNENFSDSLSSELGLYGTKKSTHVEPIHSLCSLIDLN